MKLGVLLDGWRRAGGAERHTLALMRRAKERDVDVCLATLDRGGPRDIETVTIRAPRRRPARDRCFALDGHAALKAADCDVVFAIRHALRADVFMPHGGLVLDARDAKLKSLAGEHGVSQTARGSRKEAFFVEAEQAMLAGATGPSVIAVSPMLLTRMVGIYPALKERARCVVNGVDSDHFDPEHHADSGKALRTSLGIDDAIIALFVASNWTLKGAHTALRTLVEPRVRDFSRPVHLIMAGQLPRRATRKLVRSLGVGERVHMMGEVDDLCPMYAAADLLLHPTWFDPCSLVCLEALSMGIPVITTPMNGVRDVMGQRGGIVVETPGDPEQIAFAMGVLADDALRAVTADDARYVARRQRWATALDRVLDICVNYPELPEA